MEPGKLTTHEVDGKKHLLFLPAGWSKDTLHPVLLFLHGSGGLNNEGNIRGQSLGRKLGMAEFAAGIKHIVLIPIAPSRPWSDHFAHAMSLVDLAIKDLAGDKSRVAVAGQSIGGNGTWEIAAKHPQTFACAVPICGFADRDASSAPPALISALKPLPIWAFHSASDEVVKVENTDVMVEALKAAGSSVKYTRYETAPPCILDSGKELVGHGSYETAFANPELWEWMLSQKRS